MNAALGMLLWLLAIFAVPVLIILIARNIDRLALWANRFGAGVDRVSKRWWS